MRLRTTLCGKSPYGMALGAALLVSAALTLTPASPRRPARSTRTRHPDGATPTRTPTWRGAGP